MYFRRKTSAGRAYLQIVESRRDGDQVRQQAHPRDARTFRGLAAKAGIADERLVTLGELALQRGYDRGAIGGVLLRLLMVAADDVASPRQHHRLGLVIDLLAALAQTSRRSAASASPSTPTRSRRRGKFDGVFVLRTNTDLNPLEAMLC